MLGRVQFAKSQVARKFDMRERFNISVLGLNRRVAFDEFWSTKTIDCVAWPEFVISYGEIARGSLKVVSQTAATNPKPNSKNKIHNRVLYTSTSLGFRIF